MYITQETTWKLTWIRVSSGLVITQLITVICTRGRGLYKINPSL